MAAALLDELPAPSITAKRMQSASCLSCGAELDMREAEEAQKRIRELESQVELLKEKATAAGMLKQDSACCHYAQYQTDARNSG